MQRELPESQTFAWLWTRALSDESSIQPLDIGFAEFFRSVENIMNRW